jgi:hypothetical protein
MEYHLHCRGQNIGVFPLEELRRRRGAGELSGEDLVWREGMPDWVSLNSVLMASDVGSPTNSRRLPLWGKVTAILLVLVGVTVTLFVCARFLTQFRWTVQEDSLPGSDDAIEVAGKPIITGTNTLTTEDIGKRGRDFRVRQYVEGYRNHGQHTQAWDSDAVQLLNSWIASNYGGPANLPSPRTLSDKLAALPGCDDPLILMVTGAIAVDPATAIERMERASSGFEGSPYQAYPKFYANVFLGNQMDKNAPGIQTSDEIALRYFKEALSDGSFLPGDEEEIAEVLVNGWGATFFKRNSPAVCEAVRKNKGYPWLALVIEGEYEIAQAWKARGGGFVDTVTPEGWKGFANHLAKARSPLTQAWKLHPNRPLAPERMIYVSLGDSTIGEMRTWFDRALDAQIDYQPAWNQMLWGLRPRWHGSHEAIIALGIQAVNTRRFDTDVPRMIIDCITDVESEMQLPPGKHIYGRPEIWPHLKQMYEGYLAEPSRAQSQDGWRSTYATVAYLAGDYKVAREQLEAVNWKPVRPNLTGWGTDLSLMPLKVAALTGKSGSKVETAEESYGLRDYTEAIEVYTGLNTAPDTDEQTRQFSRSRLAAIQQEKLLAKGEWIELMPANDKDPNWEFYGGKIQRLADGALEVECGSSGHGFYCRTHVGPEFEVSGEFEVIRSSTKLFQAGLIMGMPDSPNSAWYSFRMRRNAAGRDIVSFARGWAPREVANFTPLKDGRNTFQFQMRTGSADVWLNGNNVMHITHRDPSEKSLQLHDDCMVGLGAYNDMNETVIRYRNVKVRRFINGR